MHSCRVQRWKIEKDNRGTRVPKDRTYRWYQITFYYFTLYCVSSSTYIPRTIAFISAAAYSTFFGTGFASVAASLNFLHSFRCPPFFQWFTWQSRPQYCTVRHNLQGCNGRNGVLGLPQVEQQRMVGVVRPSSSSNS